MEQSKFIKQNAFVRVIFMFAFFASSIGDSFNVVYIRRMAMAVPGADMDLLVSLPITFFSALTALGVFVSGRICKRTKKFGSFLSVGLLVLMIGLMVRGAAVDYWLLFAGFGISGFGTGCLFIGIRYYAFLFTDSRQRMRALVYVNGGAFAGQCMGTILGGMLANQVAYQHIYLLSAILLFVPLIMALKVRIEGSVSVGSYADIFKVLKNINALKFLLFLLLPVYTCSVFISYIVPLYVNDYGYSTTVASVLMLINYLLSAYAGPFMTDFVSDRMSSLKGTFLYMAGSAVLIVLYGWGAVMPLLVLAVLLCGVLDSFGLSVIMDAFTKTGKNQPYSDNDALIIYILVSRVGQMIGPTLILVTGGVMSLGLFLLIGLGLYLICAGRGKAAE